MAVPYYQKKKPGDLKRTYAEREKVKVCKNLEKSRGGKNNFMPREGWEGGRTPGLRPAQTIRSAVKSPKEDD